MRPQVQDVRAIHERAASSTNLTGRIIADQRGVKPLWPPHLFSRIANRYRFDANQ